MIIRKYYKRVLLLLLAAIVFIILQRLARYEVTYILSHLPENVYAAVPIVLAIYAIKPLFIVVPVIPLFLAAGVVLSGGWSFALTCAGMFLEMTVGYFWGKRLGMKKIFARIEKHDRIKALLSANSQKGFLRVFLLRIIPLPFDMVSMFFGASRVNFPLFVAFTFLGSAPAMVPLVLMGDSLTDPFSKDFIIPFAIGAAVSVSAFAILNKLLKSRVKKPSPPRG